MTSEPLLSGLVGNVRVRPGGQRSGLSKAGGQDDVREVPHKVHVFSRCPMGRQGDHSVSRVPSVGTNLRRA